MVLWGRMCAPAPIDGIPLIWIPTFLLGSPNAFRSRHELERAKAGCHELWGVFFMVILDSLREWWIAEGILLGT